MIHLTPLGLGTSTRHEHDECAEAVAGGRHEVRGGATKEEKICTTRAVATSPLQRVQERHGGDRQTGQRNERAQAQIERDIKRGVVFVLTPAPEPNHDEGGDESEFMEEIEEEKKKQKKKRKSRRRKKKENKKRRNRRKVETEEEKNMVGVTVRFKDRVRLQIVL